MRRSNIKAILKTFQAPNKIRKEHPINFYEEKLSFMTGLQFQYQNEGCLREILRFSVNLLLPLV